MRPTRSAAVTVSPAETITNAIIERLEAGVRPWRQPWTGGPVSRPLRVCGTPYRGANVIWLWMAAHVHKLMEGTVADPLTAPEAARMAESIRAVFNANAKALRMLPTTGTPFSVKRWVTGDSKPGAILFVSARYVDMSVASRLLTVWMDTAMNTLMTLERSSERAGRAQPCR